MSKVSWSDWRAPASFNKPPTYSPAYIEIYINLGGRIICVLLALMLINSFVFSRSSASAKLDDSHTAHGDIAGTEAGVMSSSDVLHGI